VFNRALNSSASPLKSASRDIRLRTAHDKFDSLRSTPSLKPEHFQFLRKCLFFYFKAVEESIRVPTICFENIVKKFESAVIFCIRLDRSLLSKVIQAFQRLFDQLDGQNHMMEDEDFGKICSCYLTVLNNVLDNNVKFYLSQEREAIELELEEYCLDRTLDSILKRQRIRTFLINHYPLSLAKHFEVLKETMINAPKGSVLLLSNVYSCIFIFTKYVQTFNFIRTRFAALFNVAEVCESTFQSALEVMGSEMVKRSNELMAQGKNHPHILLVPEMFVRLLTHLDRHFQQLHFFHQETNIPLDTFVTKDALFWVQRILRVVFNTKRKEVAELIKICEKIISNLICYLSSIIVVSGTNRVLFKYDFTETHLVQFVGIIRQSKRSDLPGAQELVQLMNTLVNIFSKVKTIN
jgi:hypothetical protein